MKKVSVFKIGFGLDLSIITFNPLVIENDDVKIIRVKTDKGEFDGIISIKDFESRIIETSGYIFNNHTQCFMYGTHIYNTETGERTFLFALPQVQSFMNVCAPPGEMYA